MLAIIVTQFDCIVILRKCLVFIHPFALPRRHKMT